MKPLPALWTLALAAGMVLSTALWRFTPDPAVLAVSALVVIVAFVVARLYRTSHWHLAGIAGLAAVVTAMKGSSVLWPCELACAGAGDYAQLYGAQVWVFGVIAYVITAILAVLSPLHPSLRMSTAASVWMCFGASCFFLSLAWHLDLLCGHCLAVHTIAMTFLAVIKRGPKPNWPYPLFAVMSGLGMHAAYHPFHEVDSGQPRAPISSEAIDTRILFKADASRRWGSINDPIQVELVIDLQCAKCKADIDHLISGIRDLATERGVGAVVRFRSSPRRPMGETLTRHCLAAGALGLLDRSWTPFFSDRDLSPSDLEDLRNRHFGDWAPVIGEVVQQGSGAFGLLMGDDRQRLEKLALTVGPTPVLVVSAGDISQRWERFIDFDDVRRWIESAQ